MNRADILAVVMKHVRANVPAREGVTIDASRPFAEQGISSLDAVEISYGAMKDLKIRMAPAELLRLRTIDQLVDLFHARSGGPAPR
jgi:acyl carrier protein